MIKKPVFFILMALVGMGFTLTIAAWMIKDMRKNKDLETRLNLSASQLKAAKSAVSLLEDRQSAQEKSLEAKEKERGELDAKYLKLASEKEKLDKEGISQFDEIRDLIKTKKELEDKHQAQIREITEQLQKAHELELNELKLSYDKDKEALKLQTRNENDPNKTLENKIVKLNSESTRSKSESQKMLDENNKLKDKIKELESGLKEKTKSSEDMARDLQRAKSRSDQLNQEIGLTHYNLGVLYMQRGDTAGAVKEFERSLLLNPGDALAHYNLAYLCDLQLKNFDAATYHYNAYLRLLPDARDRSQVEEQLLKIRLRKETGVEGIIRVGK